MANKLELAALGLGMEARRVTSILITVLRHTGPVTLSKAEAEVAWDTAEIKYEIDEDGNMKIWIENER